jgi:hypothetical protein
LPFYHPRDAANPVVFSFTWRQNNCVSRHAFPTDSGVKATAFRSCQVAVLETDQSYLTTQSASVLMCQCFTARLWRSNPSWWSMYSPKMATFMKRACYWDTFACIMLVVVRQRTRANTQTHTLAHAKQIGKIGCNPCVRMWMWLLKLRAECVLQRGNKWY